MEIENPLARKLIDHFDGRAGAARRMGRSTETIRLWLENGIPLSQAIEVEEKSGGFVTAEEVLEDARKSRGVAEQPAPARAA